MFKRISVLVVAVLLIAAIFPMSAFATSHTLCENGHDFTVDEAGTKTCSYCDLVLVKVSGDANGDGTFDHKDAIVLLYNCVFGDTIYPLTANYDFNLNGEVDADDAIYLLSSHLYGEAEYPLYVSADPDYVEDDEIVDGEDKDQGFDDWIPLP